MYAFFLILILSADWGAAFVLQQVDIEEPQSKKYDSLLKLSTGYNSIQCVEVKQYWFPSKWKKKKDGQENRKKFEIRKRADINQRIRPPLLDLMKMDCNIHEKLNTFPIILQNSLTMHSYFFEM